MRRRRTDSDGDMLAGTLDMLILRILRLGPAHGLEIAQAIERRSDAVLLVEQGSLYPALHRIEEQGWVSAYWGTSGNNRRARFYKLSAKGRQRLVAEADRWASLVDAVSRVMRPDPRESGVS